MAIQTLKRHYAKYERTAEDDAAELARLRSWTVKSDAGEGGSGGNLSRDLSHAVVVDAYRAVYTVKFGRYLYVLHCFQKKSKRGRKTPMLDVKLVESRLRLAEADHRKRTGGK